MSTIVKAKEHPEWDVLGVLQTAKNKALESSDSDETNDEQKDGASGEEPLYSMPILELGKTMVLQSTSTKDPVSTYQRVDWTTNKRVYKHKVYIKQKAGS